jgi:hypothetical protein
LTGTGTNDAISVFGGAAQYFRYQNNDFGFVKGIVLTVNKRFASGFSSTLDYTYQVARGSASDPLQTYNALAGGTLPEVQLTPLNWDQRHTVNVTCSYNQRPWGVSVIAQYGSGTPFTPRATTDVSSLLTNSQIKPTFFNIDMRASYEFRLLPFNVLTFVRVFNLLDIRNQLGVFNTTGLADYSTDEQTAHASNPRQYVNTIDQYYRIPTFFSEPRRVEFGMNLEF